ncbi:MAG: hypothetical protein WCO33_03380 [bacterium]
MKIDAFCSICTTNYFTYARVLKDSLRKSGHKEKYFLLVVDYSKQIEELISTEGIMIVKLEDLKLPKQAELIKRYSAFELCNVLKPYFLEWLLDNEKELDKLIYLDTDIYVYSSFQAVIKYLEENLDKSVLLLPNITSKSKNILLNSNYDDSVTFMKAGLYCGGFYAIRNDASSRKFLKWHEGVLLNSGYKASNNYMFVDQKILDFAPLLFDFVGIYKNETYNIAHWNYFENTLSEKDGKYYINDKLLVFIHFTFLKIDEKEHQNSTLNIIELKNEKLLLKICLNYWKLLKENKLDKIKSIPYGYTNKYVPASLELIDPYENISNMLINSNQNIGQLKTKQVEKDNKINDLNKTIEEINRKNKELHDQLNLIFTSKSWKLTLKMRSLRNKLLRSPK